MIEWLQYMWLDQQACLTAHGSLDLKQEIQIQIQTGLFCPTWRNIVSQAERLLWWRPQEIRHALWGIGLFRSNNSNKPMHKRDVIPVVEARIEPCTCRPHRSLPTGQTLEW
jgi:hypothetical protein